jgi:hypothetical protein
MALRRFSAAGKLCLSRRPSENILNDLIADPELHALLRVHDGGLVDLPDGAGISFSGIVSSNRRYNLEDNVMDVDFDSSPAADEASAREEQF